jgi:hypothetical protein
MREGWGPSSKRRMFHPLALNATHLERLALILGHDNLLGAVVLEDEDRPVRRVRDEEAVEVVEGNVRRAPARIPDRNEGSLLLLVHAAVAGADAVQALCAIKCRAAQATSALGDCSGCSHVIV